MNTLNGEGRPVRRPPNAGNRSKNGRPILPRVERGVNLIPLTGGSRLTQTALELSEKLTSKQWEEIGRGLGKLEQSTQWWIGDWWAFGEHEYGDRKALVESEDWIGPSFQSCHHSAWVCRAFKESVKRRTLLSFNHHAEVASLSTEDADSLLDWCEAPLKNGSKRPRSIRELNLEIIRRRNDALLESLKVSIDNRIAEYGTISPERGKQVKDEVLEAIKEYIAPLMAENQAIETNRVYEIVVEKIDKELGPVPGSQIDLRFIDFIGPIRELAKRNDLDPKMLAANEVEELAQQDLKACGKVVELIQSFIKEVSTRQEGPDGSR